MSDLFLEGFWDPPNRNMTHIWTEYFFSLRVFLIVSSSGHLMTMRRCSTSSPSPWRFIAHWSPCPTEPWRRDGCVNTPSMWGQMWSKTGETQTIVSWQEKKMMNHGVPILGQTSFSFCIDVPVVITGVNVSCCYAMMDGLALYCLWKHVVPVVLLFYTHAFVCQLIPVLLRERERGREIVYYIILHVIRMYFCLLFVPVGRTFIIPYPYPLFGVLCCSSRTSFYSLFSFLHGTLTNDICHLSKCLLVIISICNIL